MHLSWACWQYGGLTSRTLWKAFPVNLQREMVETQDASQPAVDSDGDIPADKEEEQAGTKQDGLLVVISKAFAIIAVLVLVVLLLLKRHKTQPVLVRTAWRPPPSRPSYHCFYRYHGKLTPLAGPRRGSFSVQTRKRAVPSRGPEGGGGELSKRCDSGPQGRPPHHKLHT